MKKPIAIAAMAVLLNLASGAAASGNLITNGDFSAGATGFTTGYTNATLQLGGNFQVHTSPATALGAYPSFQDFGDHTTGTGLMFIANGALAADTTVWSQTITVKANAKYRFSFFATSIDNAISPTTLAWYVNGIAYGSSALADTPNFWEAHGSKFNTGAATSVTLRLVNDNLDAISNDFAVDDFSLVKISTGAVPEPASWAMMLIGFGAIGAAARSRRNPATLAA